MPDRNSRFTVGEMAKRGEYCLAHDKLIPCFRCRDEKKADKERMDALLKSKG